MPTIDNTAYHEYEILTYGFEHRFTALPLTYLELVNKVIIEGVIHDELPFISWHLFTDRYLRGVYEYLTASIEKFYQEAKDCDLVDNISNLLIILREPKARENDNLYNSLNFEYWKEICAGDPVLKESGSFKKYSR